MGAIQQKKKKPVESVSKSTTSINQLSNYLEPQKFTCFHCQKLFEIKYNKGIGMPSQKNYWLYWVDDNWDYKQMRRKPEEERGAKICDASLKSIHQNKEWELLDQIKSKSRRQTLSNYIYHKVI